MANSLFNVTLRHYNNDTSIIIISSASQQRASCGLVSEMLERSESGALLPALAPQKKRSSSKQYLHSTSLDEFISLSQAKSNNINNVQDKPLNSSHLITIPTTPVKRRRHRNDVQLASSKRDANKSSRNSFNRSQSSQYPISSSASGNSVKHNTKDKCRQGATGTPCHSPVKLPGVKLASPNNKFELSKEKLFKYRQWFMSIDADDSGTVDKEELFDSFVASGVVASEKICSKLFELMDVDGM